MLKYISIQNLNQLYHTVRELWAFWLKELDQPKWCSRKPRRRFAYMYQSPFNVNIHKFTKFERNLPCGSRVMAISLKKLDQPKWCSVKPRHHCAYQGLDNVKIIKKRKFEPNLPRRSRVMSIFTKRARPAKIMLGEASSPFGVPVAGHC